jgi:hypothetical protein
MSGILPRRCIDGDEVDAHSRRSRRMLRWKPGELAAIKRRTNKRERREGRAETRKETGA